MRKLLIIAIGVCITLCVRAQTAKFDTTAKTFIYEQVVNQPGLKNVMYQKAVAWASGNKYDGIDSRVSIDQRNDNEYSLFVNVDDSRVYIDTTINKNGSYINRGTARMSYSMRIYFKDNKYKIVVDNINAVDHMGMKWPVIVFGPGSKMQSLFYPVDASIKQTISRFKSAESAKAESDF